MTHCHHTILYVFQHGFFRSSIMFPKEALNFLSARNNILSPSRVNFFFFFFVLSSAERGKFLLPASLPLCPAYGTFLSVSFISQFFKLKHRHLSNILEQICTLIPLLPTHIPGALCYFFFFWPLY